MKTSAALILLCVGYVAAAVKTMRNTAEIRNRLAAGPGASISVGPAPDLSARTAVAGSSRTVTEGVSSRTNQAATTVNHAVSTHHTTGPVKYPGFFYGAYGPFSFLPGNGGYPSSHGGSYQSNFPWAHPGLGAGAYPASFHAARYGFLGQLYPVLEASYRGLSGGAYSRHFSEVHPGLFGRFYGSIYGSPFPSSVVLFPFPGQAQIPAAHPEFSTPGSVTTNIGNTAVRPSELVVPGISASATTSGQQQYPLTAQNRVRLGSRGPE